MVRKRARSSFHRRWLGGCLALVGGLGVARGDDLDSLLSAYRTWRGGDAFAGLRAFEVEGTLAMAGLNGSVSMVSNAEGDSYQAVDLGAIRQTQAVSARKGWVLTPSGQIEDLPADARADARAETLLDYPAGIDRARGATVTLRPDETIDGAVWRVVHVGSGAADGFDLFLEPRTGAQHGYRKTQDNATTLVRQSDWRRIDGIRFPFRIETTGATEADHSVVTVQTIRVNATPPAGWLDPPQVARKATLDATRSAIPFELGRGGHIFLAAEVNGRPVRVLLDTGAAVTVIDRAFARSVGVVSSGRVAAKGTGGSTTAGVGRGVALKVGNLHLSDATVAVIPLDGVSVAAGEHIDVIVGKELFNEAVVDIDFPNRRIAFASFEGYVPPASAHPVALMANKDGLRTVPVGIEGADPIQGLFDLGDAGILSLHSAVWKARGLDQGRPSTVASTGGIGGSVVVRCIDLASVTLGDTRLAHVPADLASDQQVALSSDRTLVNLGLGIWQRFRVIADYSRDTLYLISNDASASREFERDRSGVALERSRRGLTIRAFAPEFQSAGHAWKIGDLITRIDGRPAGARADWRYQAAGTVVRVDGVDGHGKGFHRQLVLKDYF